MSVYVVQYFILHKCTIKCTGIVCVWRSGGNKFVCMHTGHYRTFVYACMIVRLQPNADLLIKICWLHILLLAAQTCNTYLTWTLYIKYTLDFHTGCTYIPGHS